MLLSTFELNTYYYFYRFGCILSTGCPINQNPKDQVGVVKKKSVYLKQEYHKFMNASVAHGNSTVASFIEIRIFERGSNFMKCMNFR